MTFSNSRWSIDPDTSTIGSLILFIESYSVVINCLHSSIICLRCKIAPLVRRISKELLYFNSIYFFGNIKVGNVIFLFSAIFDYIFL